MARRNIVFGVFCCAVALLVAVLMVRIGFNWAAALGALFFGVSGVSLVYLERRKRMTPRAMSRSMSHGTLPGAERFTSDNGVVFPTSRGMSFFIIAIGVVFCLIGLWLLLVVLHPDLEFQPSRFIRTPFRALIVGGASVVLSLVAVAVGVLFLLRGPRGVLLTPAGIFIRMLGWDAWLPWETLAYVWVKELPRGMHNTPTGSMIAILTHHPQTIATTRRKAVPTAGGDRYQNGDLAVHDAWTRAPATFIVAQIHHYWAHPDLRPNLADPMVIAHQR